MLNEPLSELFPDLFSVPRPITTPDVPVIVAASVLTTYDAPMLPIVKIGDSPTLEKEGVKLFQAIGSFPIISLLMETAPTDYYRVIWNSCTTTSIWIGSLHYRDSLDALLRIFQLTGFGDAKVDGSAAPPALITLNSVVSLFQERKLNCKIPVSEVASKAVMVDPDITLTEAMNLMCERRIRRVFLRGRHGEFVSDRNVLAYLFSPKALRVARDTPEFWLDLNLRAIQSMKAHTISPDALVEDVGRLVEPGRDVFMLTDGLSMISRWDLVMKPWKLGHLSISPPMRKPQSASRYEAIPSRE